MTQPQIFEADGRSIPYLDDGEGPALVLLPRRGSDLAYLDTLTRIMVDEGFHVVRVGIRGASSDADLPEVSVGDLGQDVIDLMDHIGLADAWIGGHAFGGTVARTVALEHTSRVNGVLLLSVEDPAPSTDATTPAEAAVGPDALAPAVPVLIVHGTEDRISPLADAERLQASAQDRATLVRIDGAGHDFPATHPGEAAFAIAEYLDWD